ncbi:MAG: hypothetical protein LBE13_12815 [Bacteroidales bacterium]|nr:hypothetical protein [Bacteroidales bacterium]
MRQKTYPTGEKHIKRNLKILLQHIEYIIELAAKSNLNDAFYEQAMPSIRYVAKKMKRKSRQYSIVTRLSYKQTK